MCAGASSRTRDLRNFAWIDDGAAQTSAASMSPRCSCPPTPLLPLRRCCRWRCASSGSTRSGPHFPDVPPSFAAARSRRRHWGASVPASSSTTLPLRRPASTLARAATAVGDASKCSSDGGALAGLFIWSALAPSPTIALPLECTVGAVSFYSTPLKDGRGRDGGNR